MGPKKYTNYIVCLLCIQNIIDINAALHLVQKLVCIYVLYRSTQKQPNKYIKHLYIHTNIPV